MAASLASAIPTKSKNVEMISGSTLYSSSGNQNWFKKKKKGFMDLTQVLGNG